MKQEFTVTAKTVEEAYAKANDIYSALGDFTIEVVNQGKKGFLGFGRVDAEIKVIFDDGKPEAKAEKPQPKVEKPQPKAEKPQPKVEKPQPKQEKPQPKQEKPQQKAEKPQQPKQEKPQPKPQQPKANKVEEKAEERILTREEKEEKIN